MSDACAIFGFLGSVLLLAVLSYIFNCTSRFRRWASLCDRMTFGVILGFVAGFIFYRRFEDYHSHLTDWVLRQTFIPIPLQQFATAVYDFASDSVALPLIAMAAGALAAAWLWRIRTHRLQPAPPKQPFRRPA